MQKLARKHKLLFDANMPHRKYFPTLNERFDVKHIQEDFHIYGIPDSDVYRLAVSRTVSLSHKTRKTFVALPERDKIAVLLALTPIYLRRKLIKN